MVIRQLVFSCLPAIAVDLTNGLEWGAAHQEEPYENPSDETFHFELRCRFIDGWRRFGKQENPASKIL